MCRAGGCASGLERGDGRWWLSQWAPGLLDNAFRLSTEHAVQNCAWPEDSISSHKQGHNSLFQNRNINYFPRNSI